MMGAARTSETLVNVYHTTRRYNPEDSHLRTHRRENLKSYYKYPVSAILQTDTVLCSLDIIMNYAGKGRDTSVSKMIPLHAMEAHGVRGGIAPTHYLPRH
jgi:hypothetical protein